MIVQKKKRRIIFKMVVYSGIDIFLSVKHLGIEMRVGRDKMSKEITTAPLPTIRRLPSYLRVLEQLKEKGNEYASATEIAEILKQKPIQVRKDLAVTKVTGKPKIGFEIKELQKGIRTFLGWEKVSDAFLVGVGALGSALLGYGGFYEYGLEIVAAFDINPSVCGSEVHGKVVFPMEKLSDLIKRMGVKIGILTVPREYAQEVADKMVKAGIKGIWNFAAPYIDVPSDVVVQNENIASGLAVLSVKLATDCK